MLQGLNFILAHVPNIEEARAFYTEKLGLTVQAQQPGFVQFAQPGGAGATFALSDEAGHASGTGGAELWWFVDDANAVHATLAGCGVEIVSPPEDEPFGRAFAIKDVGGNTLYMLQPRQG